MADERLEWLRDYGVDPDNLDERSAAKTRLVMPAVCPSCQSTETRGRYHRGGWREYTCLDCGSEFKNRDSRIAMPLYPSQLQKHIEQNGPYAYHTTSPDNIDNILRDGLKPGVESQWDEHLQPRPGHVYMWTKDLQDCYMCGGKGKLGTAPHEVEHSCDVCEGSGKSPRTLRIDMRKLDPAKFASDEDEVVSREDADKIKQQWSDTSESLGDHVDKNKAIYDHPDMVERSLQGGSFAYHGHIPPDAIDVNPKWIQQVAWLDEKNSGFKTRDSRIASDDMFVDDPDLSDEEMARRHERLGPHEHLGSKIAHLGDDLGFHDEFPDWEHRVKDVPNVDMTPNDDKLRKFLETTNPTCDECHHAWGDHTGAFNGQGGGCLQTLPELPGISNCPCPAFRSAAVTQELNKAGHVGKYEMCRVCKGSSRMPYPPEKKEDCLFCKATGIADRNQMPYDILRYYDAYPDQPEMNHERHVGHSDDPDDPDNDHSIDFMRWDDDDPNRVHIPEDAEDLKPGAKYDREDLNKIFDIHDGLYGCGGGYDAPNGAIVFGPKEHELTPDLDCPNCVAAMKDQHYRMGHGRHGEPTYPGRCPDCTPPHEAHVSDDKAMHHANPDQLRIDHPYWDECGTCGGDGIQVGSTDVLTGEQKQSPCKDCGGIGEAYDAEYWDSDDQLHDFSNYPNFHQMNIPDKSLKTHLKDVHQTDKGYDDAYVQHQVTHGINVDPAIAEILMPKAAHVDHLEGATSGPDSVYDEPCDFCDNGKDEHGNDCGECGGTGWYGSHKTMWRVAPTSQREHIEQHGFDANHHAWDNEKDARSWKEDVEKNNQPHDIYRYDASNATQGPDQYWLGVEGYINDAAHQVWDAIPPERIKRITSKTAEFTPGDTTYPFAETQTPNLAPQPRGLDPWKDRGDNGVPLHNDMVFDPKLKKWINPEMSAMPAEVNYPGNGLMSQSSTENETSWHLTDNPKFALNADYNPENNTTLGGDYPHKGIFLGSPEHWLNRYDYVRPFVAEISHPPVESVGGYGGEKFLPADQFDKATVKRVIPLDEYCHEEFHAPGWIEESHGEHPNIPSDYRYTGPDVRDMSKDEVNHHLRRTNEYINSDRPHLLICKDCPYPEKDHKPGPDGWAWKDFGEHPFKSPGPLYKMTAKKSQTWTQSVDAPPNGGNLKRLPYDPYPEGKGETHTLDVLPAPTGEDVKKWKTVKTFPGDKSFADHPQTQDRIDNMPQVVGDKLAVVQVVGMALVNDDELPPKLRDTIEAFKTLPNVHRLQDPAQAAMRCGPASQDFADFAASRGHKADIRLLRDDTYQNVWKNNPQREYDEYRGSRHAVPYVDGHYVDWTARQYTPDSPVPRVYKNLKANDAVGEEGIPFKKYFKQRKDYREDGYYGLMKFQEGAEEWDPSYRNPRQVECRKHKNELSGTCAKFPEGHINISECSCFTKPNGEDDVDKDNMYNYNPPFNSKPTCPIHGGQDAVKAWLAQHPQKQAGFGWIGEFEAEADRPLSEQTPAEIDTEYFPLAAKHNQLLTRSLQYNQIVNDPKTMDYQRKQYRDLRNQHRAEADDVRKQMLPHEAEFQRRGGWERYQWCQSDGGHLHKSVPTCHTLTPGKSLVSMDPSASGLQEPELVEKYGYGVCTHCFKSAPTHPAYLKGEAEAQAAEQAKIDARCPGSGTRDHDSSHVRNYRAWATCDHCGQGTSVTSTGKLRAHKPRTPKTSDADQPRLKMDRLKRWVDTNMRDPNPCETCGEHHSLVSMKIDPNKDYASEEDGIAKFYPQAYTHTWAGSDGPKVIHNEGKPPSLPFNVTVNWNPYAHQRDHATMGALHEVGHVMQALNDWDNFTSKSRHAYEAKGSVHSDPDFEREAFTNGVEIARQAGIKITPDMRDSWRMCVGGEHLAHSGDDLGFHDESESWEDRAQDRGMWGSNPVPAQDNKEEEGVCRHCKRRIVNDEKDGWVDPEATGDDAVWRDMCDSHDTVGAEHEPEGPHYDEDDDPNGMKTESRIALLDYDPVRDVQPSSNSAPAPDATKPAGDPWPNQVHDGVNPDRPGYIFDKKLKKFIRDEQLTYPDVGPTFPGVTDINKVGHDDDATHMLCWRCHGQPKSSDWKQVRYEGGTPVCGTCEGTGLLPNTPWHHAVRHLNEEDYNQEVRASSEFHKNIAMETPGAAMFVGWGDDGWYATADPARARPYAPVGYHAAEDNGYPHLGWCDEHKISGGHSQNFDPHDLVNFVQKVRDKYNPPVQKDAATSQAYPQPVGMHEGDNGIDDPMKHGDPSQVKKIIPGTQRTVPETNVWNVSIDNLNKTGQSNPEATSWDVMDGGGAVVADGVDHDFGGADEANDWRISNEPDDEWKVIERFAQAQQAADVDGEREPEEPQLSDRQLHVVKNHPMMAEEITSVEDLTAFADPELQELHLQDHALNQHDHNPEVLRVAKRSS